MITLSAPVGKATGNKPKEVKAVQQLLNHHLECLPGYAPVPETGRVDQNTVDAIRTFQNVTGIVVVNSIILPNSPTLKMLNQPSIRLANRSAACQLLDQAQIRDAIVKRLNIVERSAWRAQTPDKIPQHDWDYHSIAIHHAGNSFSCSAKGVDEMRQAEAIDIKSFGQVSYHYAVDCQGVIFEALDIRNKGSHIENGNTGVIGIVFLADFSVRGEAGKYGPGVLNVAKARGLTQAAIELFGVEKDKLAFGYDVPTENQLRVADKLVRTLKEFFPIKILGGHREFAAAHGSSRACPGSYGMIIAQEMRRSFNLAAP